MESASYINDDCYGSEYSRLFTKIVEKLGEKHLLFMNHRVFQKDGRIYIITYDCGMNNDIGTSSKNEMISSYNQNGKYEGPGVGASFDITEGDNRQLQILLEILERTNPVGVLVLEIKVVLKQLIRKEENTTYI